ncbi:MAG: MBL fold metallo-hydrolase [Bacteriovoracaceae bacterium]
MVTKSYFSLQPAEFKLDGGSMFGIIPKPLWQKVFPPDDLNRIQLSLRVILIKSESKNILIDTGIGDYHEDYFKERFAINSPNDPFTNALLKIDMTPQDITDVIITHLHFDHVGGLIQKVDGKYEAYFPNATIHVHEKHYQHAINPSRKDSGSFLRETFIPVIDYYKNKNRIHWLKENEGTILENENIKYKCSFGHTPYLVHPYDEKFLYLADLIPMATHVKIPWIMAFDNEPVVSAEEKAVFLKWAFENNLTLIFEHDPFFWGGMLSKKVNKSQEIEYALIDPFKAKQESCYPIF